MHQFYAGVPGVDGAKMREQAEKKLRAGEESIVHGHSHQSDCNDACRSYILKKDE